MEGTQNGQFSRNYPDRQPDQTVTASPGQPDRDLGQSGPDHSETPDMNRNMGPHGPGTPPDMNHIMGPQDSGMTPGMNRNMDPRGPGVKPDANPNMYPPGGPNYGGNPPKKSKKTLGIVIALISILLIAAAGLLIWFQTLKKNYKAGVDSFHQQKYTEAQKSFHKAGMYHNGSKLSKICGVFEEMKNSNFEKGAELAKDFSDYTIKDKDLQKDINDIRSNYYERAEGMASGDDLQTATYIFESLLDYKDSDLAANYCKASMELEQDHYEEAIELFKAADKYKDAADLAQKCTDYLKAAELQEKGDDASLEEADKIFSSLGNFKDAPDRGLACRSVKLYRDAKAKADAGDYKGAYAILNEYPVNPYPGWTDLLEESKNQIDYAEAEKYYASENYYKAYKAYEKLGDFKDSKKKMKKCKKDTPNKSIMFQDDDYQSSSVSLTFKNTGILHNYIKMYNSNDKLVARIFVKKGGSATIHLTSGTYHINKAYGTDWYGKKDMFGDVGYYTKCKVNGSYNFVLKDHYIYTMSSGSGSGDAVSGETVGADGF